MCGSKERTNSQTAARRVVYRVSPSWTRSLCPLHWLSAIPVRCTALQQRIPPPAVSRWSCRVYSSISRSSLISVSVEARPSGRSVGRHACETGSTNWRPDAPCSRGVSHDPRRSPFTGWRYGVASITAKQEMARCSFDHDRALVARPSQLLRRHPQLARQRQPAHERRLSFRNGLPRNGIVRRHSSRLPEGGGCVERGIHTPREKLLQVK
jgi:hypothetical protein